MSLLLGDLQSLTAEAKHDYTQYANTDKFKQKK